MENKNPTQNGKPMWVNPNKWTRLLILLRITRFLVCTLPLIQHCLSSWPNDVYRQRPPWFSISPLRFYKSFLQQVQKPNQPLILQWARIFSHFHIFETRTHMPWISWHHKANTIFLQIHKIHVESSPTCRHKPLQKKNQNMPINKNIQQHSSFRFPEKCRTTNTSSQ